MTEGVCFLVGYGEKYFLGKKHSGQGYLAGKWCVPGGHVEEGESHIQVVHRESMEESKLEVEILQYLGVHYAPSKLEKNGLIQVHWYLCKASHNNIQVGSDLAEGGWFTKSEVVELCGERVKNLWSQAVRDLLQ